MKRIYILLGIIAFAELAMGQTIQAKDFEARVDSFLKKYLVEFRVSNENLDGTGQQHALDKIKTPIWKKKITLKSKKTIQNIYKQISYQRLYLAFYQFEDTIQSKAAKDTLLNCFGGDCFKIKWGEAGQGAKTIPCIFLFMEKEIISCHINCETKNEFWPKFKRDLEYFSHNAIKVLEADCGGPINFREEK